MSSSELQDIKILGIPLNYIIAAFLAVSPITSYADQTFYVWRRKSSEGFSLDTCALLIAVSSLRIFYWTGRDLELPIVLQSASMLFVQLIYLKLALMYMPAVWRRSKSLESEFIPFRRPLRFWQWRSDWKFYLAIAIFMVFFGVLTIVLRGFDTYFGIIARIAVALEAVLPLPQLILNYTRHSLSGFRFTLLFAWVSGDLVKTVFYYIDDQEYYYKIGGTIQTLLDFAILAQYIYYWRQKRAALRLEQEEQELSADVESIGAPSLYNSDAHSINSRLDSFADEADDDIHSELIPKKPTTSNN
ncbi:hypothetical protein V1511DRAFT_523550 [Dipodascopsis uninucleata]